MVSLEEKLTYSQRIGTTPKLSALNNMLSGQIVCFPNDDLQISDTDKIYYEITTAIQTNDKNKFVEFFNKKNKSNPSKDNPPPFVHDDFLIFSIIIGVVKFDCDRVWIKSVISTRTKNKITITFENILNGNFNHSENIKSIVFMYFHLIDQNKISSDFANETFATINAYDQLFQDKNDFAIICFLLSYNQIIELKTLPDRNENQLLKTFETKFTKRIKILAWLIQTVILALLIYIIYEVISAEPEIKFLFDKIGSIIKITALIGISQLGNILPWFKKWFYQILLSALGYPKELLK
ncbi:hypothetical protein AGMMS49574_24760 [Bacteroidia bacterium]|nr:hypothetical protein AGMMS49574_24760 [Bacteroidia bacterium]